MAAHLCIRRTAPALLLLSVLAACFITLTPAHAAFLRNVPQTVTQPDGTTLDCYASGDEFFNYLHDKNGYVIMQDPRTGYYVYAVEQNGDLAPTANVAGRVDPRTAGLQTQATISPARYKALRDAMTAKDYKAAPHSGTLNNIVVFIRFSGESEFTTPLSTYNTMFNTTTTGANSLVNYYREASYNSLTVTTRFYPTTAGTTVVSYQDALPRGYYQPYNSYSNTIGYTGGDNSTDRKTREDTLLKNAINAIALQIPGSVDIDGDNDGQVDNICFIIRGSATGWNSLLWPHFWTLTTYNLYLQGAKVVGYNIQLQNSIVSSGVGVLCHEMFHTLGSPDLYHYTGNGISPMGKWDLMDNDENPPQHMTAFMKYKYGKWISSIPTITHSGVYSLHPMTSSTNNCYKIPSPNTPYEYFVVEYRRKQGTFESSVPGSGLIISRINTLAGDGNADGPPDEVYVYRPGGTTSSNGTLDNANFSSDAGRTSFTDSSDPADFLTGGGMGGIAITEVGAAGPTISFRVTIPAPEVRTSVREVTVYEGNYAYLGVKLGMQPPANRTVTVTRSSGDTNLYPGGTTTLTFTTYNWNTYQYVKIYASHDTDITNGSATIRCASTGWYTAYVTAYEHDTDFARPDMQIRAGRETTYSGDNIYNISTGQTKNLTVNTGTKAYYFIKIQNDGSVPDSFTLRAGTTFGAGQSVTYFDALSGGSVINLSITGNGWSTGAMSAGSAKYLRAEVTLDGTVPTGAARDVTITATSALLDGTKTDFVEAVTMKAQVSAVSLAASPPSPSAVGTPIILSGTATGGGNVQYEFSVGAVTDTGTQWTILRAWYPTNSCTWTPTAPGQYILRIRAEDPSVLSVIAQRDLPFTINPALTNVSLAATPPSYTAVDHDVILTATPTNGGTIEYKFRQGFYSGGTWVWSVIRDYTTAPTVTWQPHLVGTYILNLYARERGTNVSYSKYAQLGYQAKPKITGVRLLTNPNSPQPVNTAISLNAMISGGARVEYLFRCGYFNDVTGGWIWTNIRTYDPNNTCFWTPTTAHNYTVQVYAREVGVTAPYEAVATIGYSIQ